MKKYFTSQDARNLINTYKLAIFPVHGVDESGFCTCGVVDCAHKGKHPATKNGFKDATNDIEQLLVLWNARKHLNVGVATGQPSNIFVIDIDSAEGERNFKALGECPPTLSVTTGKGRHLYFIYPGEQVITKRGILPGVDVRGDGGYVCGPGSNHTSGSVYDWINPLEVIQKAPDFVLNLVIKSRIRTEHKPLPQITPHIRLNQDWTIDDARNHLSHISPDCGYDEWIAVGMALQSEGFGLDLWDEWSRGGAKYDGTTGQHWKSFKPGAGVTYGTIIHIAKQGGLKLSGHNPKITTPVMSRKIAENRGKPEYSPETGEILDSGTNPGNFLIEQKQQVSKHRKLPLIYADDAKSILDTADFVENFLCENQFSVIYGESNCGKTFFMLDLAMHVALGIKWRDREVEQGGVIYAALEGGYNTQNRIVAFKNHHKITGSIPMAIIPSQLNLLDPQGDINSLVESIWEAKERIGNIKLVIIDTLSRAIHGGDENSSSDMGQLIINADSIRAVTGAHICFVHHCGKDAVKGARGHSSLRAAVDTEIEISRDDEYSPSKIKIAKQREMPMGEDMFFTLSSIELGYNQRMKPVTSCVVMPCEKHDVNTNLVSLTAIEQFVYDAIIEAGIDVGIMRTPIKGMHPVMCIDYFQLREKLGAKGFKEVAGDDANAIKSATQSARISLKKKGKISFDRNWIWLVGHMDERVAND